MRFLPSSPARAAAEILLTVAIVAFVVYDLGGRSTGKPEASSVALSFEAKKPAVSSSHFEVSDIPANIPRTTVCGDRSFPVNPLVIGVNGTEGLVIRLDAECSPNPKLTQSGTNASEGIIINSGSWLSFTDIRFTDVNLAGARSGQLIMNPGSYLDTSVSPFITMGDPGTTSLYPLLLSNGACPSFAGVQILPTVGCPIDNSSPLLGAGAATCTVVATNVVVNGAPYCSLNLVIAWAPKVRGCGGLPFVIQLSQDGLTYTQANFYTLLAGATSLPSGIVPRSWSLSPLTVAFYVEGYSQALVNQVVSTITAACAPGGALYRLFGGILYCGCGFPTNYYPLPYCFYNGQSYCGTTTLRPISSSNPALFALLTLLVIPVALILGIFVWCCLQKEVCPCAPMPVCMPEPCCFPEPTCAVPCDPCAGATYMNAAPAPLPMMTPAPYQCQ